MPPALLLTQCLQVDFVSPIGRFEPLPNLLHVGHAEALRLMGEVPSEGPVARVMSWAHAQPPEHVRVVHIRDWHDPQDPDQAEHLARFGAHCIQGTPGAGFAFPIDDEAVIIDSLTLNDFQGTGLGEVLAPTTRAPTRVGLMGVWTEAKISFLAYELRTRHPHLELAVCSALTASSSRQHHFDALDRLERILGVRVIDSVGAFVAFLGGASAELPLPGLREGHPAILGEDDGGLHLDDTQRTLIRYLFRDCRQVRLQVLDGGFSGNLVAGTQSVDLRGHDQVPHVVKIGPRAQMAEERTAFERIQEVLGNNAPHISEFADLGDHGAIKYRYASMGGGFSTAFKTRYEGGMSAPEVERVLETVFGEQLMRLYKAATLERGDILAHYQFASRWADSVRTRVEALTGAPADGETITVLPGIQVPNPVRFYSHTLAALPARPQESFYQAWVHGDLNGANIVLDTHDNVWLIDFFHTHRAHVLMDLLKLENDLLYIMTPLADEAQLREALRLTDALLSVTDLAAPLPTFSSAVPALRRAWHAVTTLRAFYPRLVQSSRDPLQAQVGMLRYAAHTLGFDESSELQRRWALYTAARCAERVTEHLSADTRLRLDWLPEASSAPGRLALTILPGRRDWRRDLDEDLRILAHQGVHHVACLVPMDELQAYGRGDLLTAYDDAGISVIHLPIPDQRAAGLDELVTLLREIDAPLRRGEAVVVHCVGGLGRSGMVAAAWLVGRGMSADEAIALVRRTRDPRAIETAEQEARVRSVPPGLLNP